MKSLLISTFALTCTQALMGCATNISAPVLEQPSNLTWSKFLSKNIDMVSTTMNPNWWTDFNDPQLTMLIQQGIPHNLNIEAARARVREARAQKRAEIAGLGPVVGLGGSATAQHQSKTGTLPVGSIPGFDTNQVIYDAGFDASWEIDIFGKNDRKADIANLRIQTAQDTQHDLTVTLASEIARNYIDLRGAQIEARTVRSNIARQQKIIDLVTMQQRYGQASDLDLERANAQLADLEIAMPNLEARIRANIYRLSVLSGQSPDILTPALMVEKPLPEASSLKVNGLTSDLLRRRSDIRAAERQYMMTAKEYELAKLDVYPTFSLFGSAGPNTKDITDLFDMGSLALSFGALADWTLYDGGRKGALEDASLARLDQAKSKYRQAVLSGLEEVEASAVHYVQSDIEVNRRKTSLIARQHIAQMLTIRYESGTGTLFEVLAAENDLADAQLGIAQAKVRSLTYRITLLKSLGGGWKSFE